jgi:transposase-like protein
MDKRNKRKFTAAFKVKVALEALKGQSTIAELSKKHELHPNQILDWKKTLIEGSEDLFSTKGKEKKAIQEDSSVLYEQIGRLQMETVRRAVSFLKKKLGI